MVISRRGFILGAGAVVGGGALFGFASYGTSQAAHAARAADLMKSHGALLGGWILISPDGATTIVIPHVDMGQGVHTALAMMTAEELDADWSKVNTIQAPAEDAFANWFIAEAYTVKNRFILESGVADPLFKLVARQMDLQMTGGSTAMRCTAEFGLRRVGAAVREMLVGVASERWSVSVDRLTTRDSVVHHAASGRQLHYGELVEDAVSMPIPRRPKLKARSDYRLIGASIPRQDIVDKVRAANEYAIDVHLPELRYATAKAAPVHGGKLISVDASPALRLSGVEHVVQLDDAVAVIARAPWCAFKALAALEPQFSNAGAGHVSTQSLYADQLVELEQGNRKDKVEIGEAGKEIARADRKIEAMYRSPFLHHAQLEPINAVGRWNQGRLIVWTGTQNPLATRTFIAEIAGLPFDSVTLHPRPLGGAFGRKTDPDRSAIYYAQIVALAKRASPYPVKLIWTRQEDTMQGWYRPLVCTRIRASLGADTLPAAWEQVFIEGRTGRSIAYPLPYAIPKQLIQEVAAPNHLHKGPFRSVNHTQHAFWRESFIDELAHATQRDPLEYRLAMLGHDARARRVVEQVAKLSNWSESLPTGVGRGIALSIDFGSIIALVVEASWTGSGVKVLRAVACVDCGPLVHPNCAAQQVEGGIIMGLSSAIDEEITIEAGAVVERSFADYRIMTLAQTPDIEVHFLNGYGPIGGLGEVGVPPAAPALGNALFSVTGLRARQTPLSAAMRELVVQRTIAHQLG
jgi:isoquinoline 1-oxidoreductase beta subunit